MQTTHEILVTELGPHQVEYDLSSAPDKFRNSLTPESIAMQALISLGCEPSKDGTRLHVTLPDDTRLTADLMRTPVLKPGEQPTDFDYVTNHARQRLLASERPSELSTGVIEAVVSVLGFRTGSIPVRRHASYMSA